MTTRTHSTPARDERGSALLLSLILIFVMTVLGLALFDLGVVENRLVYTSQDDARAFEIAQAGVERALGKLQDTFNNDPLNPRTWAVGSALCAGGRPPWMLRRPVLPCGGQLSQQSEFR